MVDHRLAISYLVLLFGVTATSFAAVFIRLADAPALVVAAGRLCVASAVLAPVAILRAGSELRTLNRREWVIALSSGALLALHFALWVSSLQYTSVASSLALVTTSPFWVALAAFVFLREKISALPAMGIVAAVAGSVVIGGGDFQLGGTGPLGDLLALGGGTAVAGYFLLGRRLRARLSLLAYIAIVYAAAALCLLAAATLSGATSGCCSGQALGMIVLLGLIPQLLGHSSYNFALHRVSATTVSVATLGEPIGSTVLAALILRETPPPTAVAGGALVLAGIAAVLLGETKRNR
jgi:drug/metabolite transporter (DMT)-like permease